MPETSNAIAILFADLGESTHLYETLGDERARALTASCLRRMIDAVHHHGGTLIKTIGDEVMATFPAADAAAAAALDILSAVGASSIADGARLGAHVGFHFGPVLHEEGDVFGDAVNVAARIVSLARTGEILTTRQAVEALSPARRTATRQIDRRSLRGREESLDVFQLLPETEEATAVISVPFSEDRSPGRLVLWQGEDCFVVSPEHPSLTIGRDLENELVLADPRVSRRHARVRLRHGKFVLRDESTNGTLVMTDDGKAIALHREDLTLQGSGRLGVTPARGSDPDLRLRFLVEPRSLPSGGGRARDPRAQPRRPFARARASSRTRQQTVSTLMRA